MRLKLHAGAHKTATSTIQLAIADVKSQLRDNGVHYITREEFVEAGCLAALHNLGTSKHKEAEETLVHYFSNFDSSAQLLISHESFFGYATQDFDSLKHGVRLYSDLSRIAREFSLLNIFEEIDIRFYTRNPRSFAQSVYFEYLQSGVHEISWEEYAAALPSSFAWEPVIEELEEAFGKKCLKVIKFESLKDSGVNSYLKDFFDWAAPGAQICGYKARRERPRFSLKAYEVALAIWPILSRQQRRKITPILREKFPIKDYGESKMDLSRINIKD